MHPKVQRDLQASYAGSQTLMAGTMHFNWESTESNKLKFIGVDDSGFVSDPQLHGRDAIRVLSSLMLDDLSLSPDVNLSIHDSELRREIDAPHDFISLGDVFVAAAENGLK